MISDEGEEDAVTTDVADDVAETVTDSVAADGEDDADDEVLFDAIDAELLGDFAAVADAAVGELDALPSRLAAAVVDTVSRVDTLALRDATPERDAEEEREGEPDGEGDAFGDADVTTLPVSALDSTALCETRALSVIAEADGERVSIDRDADGVTEVDADSVPTPDALVVESRERDGALDCVASRLALTAADTDGLGDERAEAEVDAVSLAVRDGDGVDDTIGVTVDESELSAFDSDADGVAEGDGALVRDAGELPETHAVGDAV